MSKTKPWNVYSIKNLWVRRPVIILVLIVTFFVGSIALIFDLIWNIGRGIGRAILDVIDDWDVEIWQRGVKLTKQTWNEV